MSAASHWSVIPAPEPGCYYRVACTGCGLTVVKATARNVELHQRDHTKRCAGGAYVVQAMRHEAIEPNVVPPHHRAAGGEE